MYSTANQAYVFLATVYAGFIIGFIYDLCRMIRYIIKPGKWLTGMLDLIFWILIGLISFAFIFHINSGDVRIYNVFGFAVGWILYALILSPIIMKVMIFIYKAVVKVLKYIINIIIWPFCMIKKILTSFFHSLKKLTKKSHDKMKELFKSISFKGNIKDEGKRKI